MSSAYVQIATMRQKDFDFFLLLDLYDVIEKRWSSQEAASAAVSTSLSPNYCCSVIYEGQPIRGL